MSIHFYGWLFLDNKSGWYYKVEIAKQINLITAKYGYAIQMGLWNLFEDIRKDLLKVIRQQHCGIEDITENEQLISFNLLANPLEQCAHFIFTEELNLKNRKLLNEVNFIKYLNEVWNIQSITDAIIFISSDPGCPFDSFPYYKISFNTFLRRIYDYFIILPEEPYGKDGIYEINK